MQTLPRDRVEIVIQRLAVDRETGALDVPKKAGDGGIAGIPSGRNPNHAIERRQSGGVKQEPLASDIDLEAGVEILRLELVGVDRRVSGRDGEGTAQSDGEVGKVPADALSLCHDVDCRRLFIGGAGNVFDVFKDPLGNG